MSNHTFKAGMIFLLLFGFSNFILAEELKEEGTGLYTFICAGLKLSDHGMRMDREAYFYNESTQKLLCVTAMGTDSCAVHTKDKPCTCPPPEWKANKCWEKLSEFSKVRDLEYRKWYDSLIKKNKP